MRRRLTLRALTGDVVMCAFVVAQASDGALTYLGVTSQGIQLEANPIVAWYMWSFGPALALVGAKSVAVLCAFALHYRALHGTIALLTALYVAAAVLPWSLVLWP